MTQQKLVLLNELKNQIDNYKILNDDFKERLMTIIEQRFKRII